MTARRRIADLERRLEQHERTIVTLARWLVQAGAGFNANDVRGIERLLQGENPAGPPPPYYAKRPDGPPPPRDPGKRT